MPDLIDTLLPAGAAVRALRPEARDAAQASLDALLHPADPGGLSHAERAAAAVQAATLHGDAALAAGFQAALDAGPTDGGTARARAIAAHVERLTLRPDTAGPADLDALRAEGLLPRDIVSLSQLVALVSFQARLLAGLRLMEAAP